MEQREKIPEDFEALGIPLRSEQLDAVVGRAECEGLLHLEFLRLLIGEQANGRRERRITHRVREAGFAESKTLADFDWQFNAAVTHLERAVYIYIRQSTMHQVREHLESQRRQYELAEKARQLKFREVVVIDDDLGRSGADSQERPGFGKLLAAVCDG